MKRIYVAICLLLFTAPINYAQVKPGFTIEGYIKGLKTGSKLCMVIKRSDKIDTIAKAMTTNGMFRFKNVKLPVYPEFYLVCIQTEFLENLQLFLDQAGDVNINGDLKKWPNVKVTGSKTHTDHLTYRKLVNKFNIRFDSLMNENASAQQMKENSMLPRLWFIKENPDSFYIPYMLLTSKDEVGAVVNPEVKKPYFDRLPAAVKNSHYGKLLSKQMTDYAESKGWMIELEKSIVDLNGISRTDVSTQLIETANKQVSVSVLPTFTKQLSNAELEAKSKAATLILNMGFRNAGDNVTRSNPTTAYVIDGSGICVTNYHVGVEYSSKEPYQSLSVMTADGKAYPVTKILSCSESDDLMVFQVDTKEDKLNALPLGNSAANGANIYVMAHPLGKFYQLTSGVISGYSTSALAGKSCNIMSITADFNVGSSGGPVVDDYGNVVGTVSRISGGMKVGVPVSELKKLIEFKK